MFPGSEGPIQHSTSRQFLEPLRPADQPIASHLARVKGFHEQFQKARLRRQELEYQAAKAVRLYEANELSEGCIGVGRASKPAQQEGSQLAKDLPRPRRDVETRCACPKLRHRFCS